ncbi:hypothetical protein K0B96_17140 [Horticoccus luteus]|uniref:Uncharacterized protein n=1 Tax=Horticoccus luteus TaxID=2862869 RepID=A0A8F9TTY0_9BACT|nr:hypothetical protein [Horticoccus luteus]QYM79006.1 hypothetical protein K0B96_17140 [Horticoccus luteus]
MNPRLSRFALTAALIALVLLCLLFPRMLAFAEIAGRELRYLWWLVLIIAVCLWLSFKLRPRK